MIRLPNMESSMSLGDLIFKGCTSRLIVMSTIRAIMPAIAIAAKHTVMDMLAASFRKGAFSFSSSICAEADS